MADRKIALAHLDRLAGRAFFQYRPVATRGPIHASFEQAWLAASSRGQATAGRHLQDFPARLAGPVQSAARRPGPGLRETTQPDRTLLTGCRPVCPRGWPPAVMFTAAVSRVPQTTERGLPWD